MKIPLNLLGYFVITLDTDARKSSFSYVKFVAKSSPDAVQLFEAVERAYIELPVRDWDALISSLFYPDKTRSATDFVPAEPEPNEALKSGFRWYRNIKNS